MTVVAREDAIVKLGFIGGWGHNYLSQLLNSSKVKVESIAFAGDGFDDARAKTRAEALRSRGMNVTWFDDPCKMLDEARPDAVNVGTWYGHNGDFVAACMERNIPVCSDKPIASTWSQLERIESLAKKNHAPVVSEFPFRSDPAVRAARDAVRDGKIGEVVLATGQKSYRFGDKRPDWYANRADYGGTILWVASHAIDFVWFATGLKFTTVYGQQGNVSKKSYGSMEEATVSVLTFENGGHAIIHADYNRPAKAATHGDDRLRIAGSKGVVEVRDGRCKICTHDTPEEDITDLSRPSPVCDEMWDALQGVSDEFYSTSKSLEIAKVLLAARDAADGRKVIHLA